jgi:hypothetical protein
VESTFLHDALTAYFLTAKLGLNRNEADSLEETVGSPPSVGEERRPKQKAPCGALLESWWPAGDSVEEATICPQAGRAPEVPGDAADLSIRRAFLPLRAETLAERIENMQRCKRPCGKKAAFSQKI